MNLFGRMRKNPPPQINPNQSIAVLSDAIDTLQKREIHLHKQSAAALAQARQKSKVKDKRGALFQLRRKKMFEKELDSIAGRKQNMEIQKLTIETAMGNKENLKIMKDTQKTLSTLVDEKTVEDADEVFAQIEENQATSNELDELLGRPLGPLYDDDELLAELEEMDTDVTKGDKSDLQVPPPILKSLTGENSVKPSLELPLPKEVQEVQEVQEDRELAELQAEFA